MGQQLTDEALRDELVAAFGVKRALSLMGWCAIFVWARAEDPESARAVRFGSQSARYQAVHDLREFAAVLRDKGYDLGQLEIEPATPRGLINRLAPA